MEDQFLTLKEPSEGYYMDRGSKFLAYAFPVSSESEASQVLLQLKKDHPKARHYCTALRLHADQPIERINDDGEPSGSAGRTMLGQLIRSNLTNVIVIVVRYFGGTKLGVPGLIEAYKSASINALEKGQIIERKVFSYVRIEMPFERHPLFLNYCKMNSIPVIKEDFQEYAIMTIAFSKSTVMNDLKETLHHFSQMDFEEIDDYLRHLNMKAEFIPGDYIF